MKDERLEDINRWWQAVYDDDLRTAVYLFCKGMAEHVEKEAQERRAALKIT